MVEIIRNMVVADRGNARQFVKGPVPADVGADTIGRLRRAGALAPEVLDENDDAAIDAFAKLASTKLPKGKAR
ncbi:hypothetical protein NKJ10_17640 [Mesorhizobium sp. M0204]|uniref:hypothetical protein n=1 Tax=Mesorhizobium sp. M0204 TaxID=2956913 RepID=UPI003337D750